MKKYYTAESAHGSETSQGFANDTIVKVWDSKKSRDAYLDNVNNISAKAITRDQVTYHATNLNLTTNKERKPRYGERWGINTCTSGNTFSGLIGTIEIDTFGEFEPFYK